MEIAAQAEAGHWADALTQVLEKSSKIFPVVVIAFIGVRSSHDVVDAIGCGYAAHAFRGVPGFGAIVDFGKDVAVNVNHGLRRL